jgi:hypothetical protein
MEPGDQPLGTVDVPSGCLLLLDLGLARRWRHDAAAFDAHPGKHHDLQIVGADAEAAGRAFDLDWDPTRLHDVVDVERVRARFEERARELGLDARAIPLPAQVPHAERARRALAARGSGLGVVTFGGARAVVASVDPGARLEVIGNRRAVELVADPDARAATAQRVDGITVKHGQLLCVDLDAIAGLRSGRSLDGLADLVFWGSGAAALAARHGAAQLEERLYGWRDVVMARLDERAAALDADLAAQGLHAVVDRRPHDPLELLLAQIRSSPTHSGVVDVGGALVTGCHHGLPAGLLAVSRLCDPDGRVVQLRIDGGA